MSQGIAKQQPVVVPHKIQSMAALYGLAVNLVNLTNIPHRKDMKRTIKKLRKKVIKAVGHEGGEALLNGNKLGVEMYVRGIKGNDSYIKEVRSHQLDLVKQSWLGSYNKGVKKAFGG